MIFGKVKAESIASLKLNDECIEYVSHWTYLGATVVSGTKFSLSCKKEISAFYRSFNSLLSVVRKPNELVLMRLLYSNCVPCLTYAAEVKDLTSRELNDCNVALNNAIRRIFSFNRWESTRFLRQQLGYPNVTEIFSAQRNRFVKGCQKINSPNEVVRQLSFLRD